MKHEKLIIEQLREQIGLDVLQAGQHSVCRQIRQALERTPDPDQLLDLNSTAWQVLLHAVLIPETWFFRNPESFEALVDWAQHTWLPAHSGVLRILSLPCATGEEPYSIAMALLEAGIEADRFEITAGDAGTAFLEKAKAGVYGRNSFRSPHVIERFGRFFESRPDGHRCVRPEVRRLVRFRPMNLIRGPLASCDVLFCRNALIYLDEPSRRIAWERLDAALAEDGLLFLGPVEPPLARMHGFATIAWPMSFACRKALAPDETTARSAPTPAPPWKPRNTASASAPTPAPRRKPRHTAPAPPLPHPQTPVAFQPTMESLEQIKELADAGKTIEAADKLNQMLTGAEPSAELFCLCGVVHEALKLLGPAEQYYRKALFLDPDHTESLLHLGLLLELEGRTEAARPFQQRIQRRRVS